ncbi:MAG TPA: DUF4349 domain-containing protein [Bacteroidia bacterium]|nr:DUF4349 domain-containing protein [Bacteroidia bacterium]
MKNSPSRYLPVILFTGILIYSCNASDRSPNGSDRDEVRKTNRYAETQAMADSTASGGFEKVPYEEQENSPGNKNIGFRSAESRLGRSGDLAQDQTVNTQAYFMDQTEINNNEYRNFVYMMRSTAARPTKLDSTHRFIRTADIKFRVKNVAFCSYRIEDLARKFEGYVADTKLNSQLTSSYEKPVSADSSLQTEKFIVTNTIILRIPVENLDTTLKALVPMIDYLDYRNVNTNDITLDLLANKLAQARIFNYNHRLSLDIDNKGKKLDDVQSAEESMLSQQENSDNALIENLRKDDQVKYSTVTINIYQKETFEQELIAREKDVDEYEPGLGTKLGSSLQSGWHGLQAIIVGIVMLWPLWLIAAATWFLIRFLLRRNKKLKS